MVLQVDRAGFDPVGPRTCKRCVIQQRSKQLTRSTISAVLKEASCVSGRDCTERLTHSLKTSASRLLLASTLRRRPLSCEKASEPTSAIASPTKVIPIIRFSSEGFSVACVPEFPFRKAYSPAKSHKHPRKTRKYALPKYLYKSE